MRARWNLLKEHLPQFAGLFVIAALAMPFVGSSSRFWLLVVISIVLLLLAAFVWMRALPVSSGHQLGGERRGSCSPDGYNEFGVFDMTDPAAIDAAHRKATLAGDDPNTLFGQQYTHS